MAAQPSKQPDDCQSPKHFEWIERSRLLPISLLLSFFVLLMGAMMSLNRTILGAQVEAGPEQFCPEVVANWARGNPELLFEMAWRGKHPLGIEASFHPSPIDHLAETAVKHTQEAMLSPPCPGLAWMFGRDVEGFTTELAN